MRYPGGKGRCYQQIINVMPPHRVYIEAFLGGGAVIRNKRPAERSIGIDIDPAVIAEWERMRWPGTEWKCVDACEFLSSFAFSGDELVYADPPYLPHTRRKPRCYRHDFTSNDHLALLATLKALPCLVILSGYPSRLYDEALAGWCRLTFTGTSHVGKRTEALWLNFSPGEVLHDYRFVGRTFRERDRLRRMAVRWERRLNQLPPVERQFLLRSLRDRFRLAETQ